MNQYSYRAIDPESLIGHVKDVYLMHVESPESFFLNLCESRNANGTMLTELNKFCQNPISQTYRLNDFTRHTPCAARYSLDHGWYRGRIEGNFSKITRKVKVFYVDFGNAADVDILELKSLAGDFFQLPCQAIHCKLNGAAINPELGCWTEDAKRIFYKHQLDHLRIDFLNYDPEKGQYAVDLFFNDLERNDTSQSILEELCSENLAISELDYNPTTGLEDEMEHTVFLRQGFPHADIILGDENRLVYTKRSVECYDGSLYPVNLIRFESLDKFYLGICHEKCYARLVAVEKRMMSIYGCEEDPMPFLPLKRYRIGSGCIAWLKHTFFRCEIIDVHKFINPYGQEEAFLDLVAVDYGEVSSRVPSSDVFVVADDELLKMTPRFAICCSLKEAQSSGNGEDDAVVRKSFDEMVLNRKCLFLSVENRHYEVSLLMAKGDTFGNYLITIRVAHPRAVTATLAAIQLQPVPTKKRHNMNKKKYRSIVEIQGLRPLIIPACQNSYCDVNVIRIKAVDSFFVSLVEMSDEFLKLNSRISETYENNAFRVELPNPRPGKICVAKRMHKFQYGRAVVTKVLDRDTVEIYMFDMALLVQARNEDLYILTDDFLSYPPMVFECSLNNVTPSLFMNEKFAEYVANAQNLCISLDRQVDQVFEVTMHNVLFPVTTNINDYLSNLDSQHRTPRNLPSAVANNRNTTSLDWHR